MSDSTRKAVHRAFDNGTPVYCHYCARRLAIDVPESAPDRAVADHRTPRSRGGSNRQTNLAVVCNQCNTRKGPLTECEYRSLMHDPRLVEAAAMRIRRALEPGAATREVAA